MVNRLPKYRAERDRNTAHIVRLQARNDVLDRKITEGENSEIRALLFNANITVDELAALIRAQQEGREPAFPTVERQFDVATDADEPINPANDAKEYEDTEDDDDTEENDDDYDA